jgi:hypothetical protein
MPVTNLFIGNMQNARYQCWIICNAWSVMSTMPITNDHLCTLWIIVFHIVDVDQIPHLRNRHYIHIDQIYLQVHSLRVLDNVELIINRVPWEMSMRMVYLFPWQQLGPTLRFRIATATTNLQSTPIDGFDRGWGRNKNQLHGQQWWDNVQALQRMETRSRRVTSMSCLSVI